MIKRNEIIQGDCVEILGKVTEPVADLIFADPPFNIGYKYDVYEDRKAYDDYYQWTHDWMAGCQKILKPNGSFWVAIGDDYAAEVRVIARKLGLNLRNWVIWHYTFGQNTKAKFSRSHTHLFYFTIDTKDFTFNVDAVRVMSDRQKEYADKRANPRGRTPFDVWHEFPRVCGTFESRLDWHPCQMPESLLARIIRACSNPGNLVFDPFAGSGTTLAVAKKLGRDYWGTELSSQYVKNIRKRLKRIEKEDVIVGERSSKWPPAHRQELASLYMETGLGTEYLHRDPELWHTFAQQFNARMENLGFADGYASEEIWNKLERMRKSGKLGRIRMHVKENAGGTSRPAPIFEDS